LVVGPATVVLRTIGKELDELTYFIRKPINIIGKIM
jgi:hypothetical protein